MKKCIVFLFALLMVVSAFPQRFQVITSVPGIPFKRHYSYSIENGYVEGQGRQYIAGNQTDWLVNSKVVKGNAINGTTFSIGKAVELTNETSNIILTDFDVSPGKTYEYIAGTGMYLPEGPGGFGYPYLGIYERGTGLIVSLVYFDLLYDDCPADVRRNTAATRVKYSPTEKCYYISGIMTDRLFVGMGNTNFYCHSKGFIMKVNPENFQASVIVFNPDPLYNSEIPWMSSVNDIAIDPNGQFIEFTGVNTIADFAGGNQPMVGKVDMNLNLQWCYAFQMADIRYSGVDVELSLDNESSFVLLNSERRPFSIMELDMNGNVIQQPNEYDFAMIPCDQGVGIQTPTPGDARAHIMHATEGGGLIVTGNFYVNTDAGPYQSLFSYDIPNADNLAGGNNYFGTYSCDPVPIGQQDLVTSWWAPENSILRGKNLYIVGAFNNDPDFGYTYIDVSGFDKLDPHCYRTGDVHISHHETHLAARDPYFMECSYHDLGNFIYNWDLIISEGCGSDIYGGKSVPINEDNALTNSWKYEGIDEGGIHLLLSTETLSEYQIDVFDVTGRKVFSSKYSAEGQKNIYLNFSTGNQLYLLSVANGSKTETMKVSGVR